MTTFDSIIIATEQPAVLADWYSALLQGERQSDNEVQADGLRLVLFPHDEVSGSSAQPKRMMVNFAVDDAKTFTAHADALKVTWLRPFEPELFGQLATIVDPDGNYVQFIQHNPPANT